MENKELKTLKDVVYTKEEIDGDFSEEVIEECSQDNLVKISDLKQEAIKEIKFLRANTKEHNCDAKAIDKYFAYDCCACSEGYMMCGFEILENYIKWKFNITEEDLK